MALSKRIPIILLRLIALCATLGAVITMITAKETAQVYNMSFKAKYTDSPSFNNLLTLEAFDCEVVVDAGFGKPHFMYFFCSLALIAN
ncbi:hypothetical protein LIER_31476 [Lithospermum erythrorhizon]|uniref:CASP-like protein n=1 Tax=Lithospermum erythrorhizon TaxID=34254 RepID=A0AAV3RR46_LITER